ncbi:hypothetical protein SARC_15727, partial [Sphaeroforma arctica JP610]
SPKAFELQYRNQTISTTTADVSRRLRYSRRKRNQPRLSMKSISSRAMYLTRLPELMWGFPFLEPARM